MDCHASLLRRPRRSAFVEYCDCVVDLGPGEHRCLADIALARTQHLEIVCKRLQLR